MSLKAKIEAVIYASEEPVTLAQLTGLLGEEGQAELNTLADQQQSLALEDESAIDSDEPEPVEDADALNAETTDPAEILGAEPAAETTSELSTEPDSPTTEPEAVEPVLDDKKLARDAAAEVKLRERKLRDYFRSLLDQLIADYANGDRGLEIREVAGGFRLGTKAEYHDAVRGFVKSLKPPLKLTLQALETLAVVAYKQPVTAPEVSEIRGVDSAGVLGSLLTRKLVTTAGRKQVIGRPILYKTTKDFLLRFGLKDINELPSIEEFEKMAGELNDAVQEEIQMEEHIQPSDESPDESSDNSGPHPPRHARRPPQRPLHRSRGPQPRAPGPHRSRTHGGGPLSPGRRHPRRLVAHCSYARRPRRTVGLRLLAYCRVL
jgi:segregation and condensation protein B